MLFRSILVSLCLSFYTYQNGKTKYVCKYYFGVEGTYPNLPYNHNNYKTEVKGLGKVLSYPGLCSPLEGGEDLFYDYFRVVNSVWVLRARHMCY